MRGIDKTHKAPSFLMESCDFNAATTYSPTHFRVQPGSSNSDSIGAEINRPCGLNLSRFAASEPRGEIPSGRLRGIAVGALCGRKGACGRNPASNIQCRAGDALEACPNFP